MSATFHPELDRALDRVRLLVGDTDSEHPLLDDETYQGVIERYGETEAAAYLATSLASTYGQLPVRVDEQGVTLDYSERVRTWQALAATLRANPPTTGGVTVGRTSVLLPSRAGWGSTVDEYGRPPRYPL
jgi:uncharacterized iron-regulated membrane protein